MEEEESDDVNLPRKNAWIKSVWSSKLEETNKAIKAVSEQKKQLKENSDCIRKLKLSNSQDRRSLEEEVTLRTHNLEDKLKELNTTKNMMLLIIEGHTGIDQSLTEDPYSLSKSNPDMICTRIPRKNKGCLFCLCKGKTKKK